MTNYTVIDNSLITDTDLSDSAYRLYNFMLSMCYGDKDTCFPSIAYLAEKLHKSVKTIGRNLRILKDKGFIVARRRGSVSNLYTLVKKALQVEADKLVNTVKGKFAKSKPQYTKKKSNWDNVEQRSYDGTNGGMTYADLENGLLGWDDKIKTDRYGTSFVQSYIK